MKDPEAYHQWLKEYHALDVYATSLRDRSSGAESLLEYARAMISLNKPEQALEILENMDKQDNPRISGLKEWLSHKALRILEDYDLAVLSIIRASRHLGIKDTAEMMKQEPGLERLWSDVWKKWYFQTPGPGLINQGQSRIMDQALILGKAAWPDQSLWSEDIVFQKQNTKKTPAADEILIARSLALWSIGHFDMAANVLSRSTDEQKKNFFLELAKLFSRSADHLPRLDLESPKSRVFYQVFQKSLQDYALENFRLSSPLNPSWDTFLDQIREVDVQRAMQLIRQELSSALLSREIRRKLLALKFTFELQEDPGQAAQTWDSELSETSDLPFTLFLSAALIKHDLDPLTSLPSSEFPFFKELLNSAGFNPDPENMAGFWQTGEIEELYAAFPLDYCLNYLYYNQDLVREDTLNDRSAASLAFLFPYTEAGQNAFLELARQAYAKGNKELAWKYLQNISREFAQGPRQMDLLEAKAGILLDMGREDESLAAYKTILNREPDRLTHKKRLNLALLAQENNNWDMAGQILEDLWAEKNQLEPEMQAEVLFWLGEGAQLNNQIPRALDYYLRLAWKYPEQNIWAVTAMYRAGLIYEQKGMHKPAASLFQSVVKNADTKSQKEAARQRLDNNQSMMESRKNQQPYLF
ncbi:MAG: tetratricopeptide repeat protein [Desulfonatronovibrionaceae bacterium]